jgi:hypothetical protein
MKENKSIDQIAKDALEHYEMPYEPMHWDALESRMNAAQTPRSASVIAIKAIELLLMTITLFSLLHYANQSGTDFAQPSNLLPFVKTEVNAASLPLVNNEQAVVNTKTTHDLVAMTVENATQNTVLATNTAFAKAKQKDNKTPSALPNIPLLHTYNTYNINTANTPNNEQRISTQNTAQNTAQAATQNVNTTTNNAAFTLPDDEHIIVEAAPSVVHTNSSTNSSTNVNTNINTGVNVNTNVNTSINTNTGATPNINSPNTSTPNINSTNNSTNFGIEKLPIQPIQNIEIYHNDLHISIAKSMPIAASYDTPYETASMLRRRPVLKGIAGYEWNTISQFSRNSISAVPTKSNRFGLGIMVNVYKKLRLETALEVTHKNYQTPNEVTNFLNSSSNQIIQNTAMLLAEVPISANINIVETPKLDVYIKAGARFSNLITAQYSWRNGTDAAYSTYNTSLTSNSRINSEQYDEITNATSFWSLGGGVGISYHVSPRVSLFAEPSIYRALSGIGQRKDYINSMGIGLGASCVL